VNQFTLRVEIAAFDGARRPIADPKHRPRAETAVNTAGRQDRRCRQQTPEIGPGAFTPIPLYNRF
jgi:hypothetical protein